VRALIVHCHPEPSSFNAALKDVSVDTLGKSGHEVRVSDLYAEGFDPVEKPSHFRDREDPSFFSALAEQRHASRKKSLPTEIREEIARLQNADLVVLQFPLWWHGPPAMLKGWFDRVFVNGGLYSSNTRYDQGHFRGKSAVCSVTTGAPARAFGPNCRGGDIDHMLWPVHYSLHYMGFNVLPPFVAFGIQGHGFSYELDSQHGQRLDRIKCDWKDRLKKLAEDQPLWFPGWKDWDREGRWKHADSIEKTRLSAPSQREQV